MQHSPWPQRLFAIAVCAILWRSCSTANEAKRLAEMALDQADAVHQRTRDLPDEIEQLRSDVEASQLQGPF